MRFKHLIYVKVRLAGDVLWAHMQFSEIYGSSEGENDFVVAIL